MRRFTVFENETADGATTPAFAAGIDFPVGDGPRNVVLGDIDRDGKLDAAVANDTSADISVLLSETP